MSLTVSNSKNVSTSPSPTSPTYSPTSPRYSPESKARSVEENPWKKSLLRRLELQFPESEIGFNCNSRNCMGNCSTCVWKQEREAQSYHFHKEGGVKSYAVQIIRDTEEYMELDAVIAEARWRYEDSEISDIVTEFVDDCYIEDVAFEDFGFVPTVMPVGKHSFLDDFEYLSRTIAPDYLEEHVRHLRQEAHEEASAATERANHLDQVYTAVQAHCKRKRDEDSTEDSDSGIQIIRKKTRN